jgi:hypothetical protein
MNIPENVKNPKLYMKAKKIADETYKRHSAYKSMFIQKKYQDLGGKYSGAKTTKGVDRWNKEKWVQVIPFIEEGKRIPCGYGSKNKACRPTVRIDKETPTTLQSLVKKHGKKKILELARIKKKDMGRRVNWEKATFT